MTSRIHSSILFLLHCLIVLLAVPSSLFAAKASEQEKAGAVLFRDKGCTYCHGVGGVGTKKAPALIDLPKETTWTADKLTDQILNGGQKMPPFRDSVTDEEVSDLIAYLRAKNKPVPPDVPSPDASPAPSPR
ncbi:cytochrome c [Telmatobacter sp. DSM 110680]|uniref:Cytochrome c n=1 Tax=Telmatobacter sp. DSM 110680 TaxID=3036704 RepID=A0AAU7DGK4_9BACT